MKKFSVFVLLLGSMMVVPVLQAQSSGVPGPRALGAGGDGIQHVEMRVEGMT